MISQADFSRLRKVLPFLQRAEPELVREFTHTAFSTRIPAGKEVFVEGDRVETIALLLSGVVRVYKIGETGREITLYRFGSGESCILIANAILSLQSFPAIAAVEQEAEAVIIPAAAFRAWVGRHELWREFVFDLLSQRLGGVMALVDEVVFQRMDTRVMRLLVQRTQTGRSLRITHQEIAAELGSSREVISRLLEDLAARGLIRTARGTIEIVDYPALQAQAAK